MARRRTYSDWVFEVNDLLNARGLRFEDYSTTWYRQAYNAGLSPEQAVDELLSGRHENPMARRWQNFSGQLKRRY